MLHNAESESGPVHSKQNDPRLTRIGKFLRKSRIDELPQLYNILRGDLSFVGPRPIREYFANEFSKTVPFYELRHNVKPGLTGWAQVNGLRGDTSIEERTKYDLWYIENWSLWLDLKIIALTVLAVLRRTNAY